MKAFFAIRQGWTKRGFTRSLPINYIQVNETQRNGDVSWENQSLQLADFNVRLATDGHAPDL